MGIYGWYFDQMSKWKRSNDEEVNASCSIMIMIVTTWKPQILLGLALRELPLSLPIVLSKPADRHPPARCSPHWHFETKNYTSKLNYGLNYKLNYISKPADRPPPARCSPHWHFATKNYRTTNIQLKIRRKLFMKSFALYCMEVIQFSKNSIVIINVVKINYFMFATYLSAINCEHCINNTRLLWRYLTWLTLFQTPKCK